MRDERGFLVLEIFIAGLILTASVAATMYLFRIGAESLQRANDSNLLSSKLPHAISLIKNLDLGHGEGSEDMGDGILLAWKAKLLINSVPKTKDAESGTTMQGMHELSLYDVEFTLEQRNGLRREYRTNALRHRTLASARDMRF